MLRFCAMWDNITYVIVLCEYSKFWIESNSYFSIQLDNLDSSTIIQNFHMLTVTDFFTYLTKWCQFLTLATTPCNQQNLLLTMVQVLYLLEVFILAHYYGQPSTETPTTEITIVRCHRNCWIYLTSTYYWLTFETNDNYSIRFEISNNSSMVTGTFAPKNFCSRKRKFYGMELSLPGTKVMKNFRSRELSLHCTYHSHSDVGIRGCVAGGFKQTADCWNLLTKLRRPLLIIR